MESMKKKLEDLTKPLEKKNEEMKSTLQVEKVLEEKGVQDVDLDDVLDNDDGVKYGLKVTYNNILDLEKELPIRIKLDVYFEDKLIFDEFGNPCMYECPIIMDHVPNENRIREKKKKRVVKKLDVEIDEVQYVLKHIPGYIELFKKTKNVYLRFVMEEIVEIGQFKDIPSSYLRKHKLREVGYFIFKLTDGRMNIREGRFKNVLYRTPKLKPPPNPNKELKMIQTSLDFTIELFEFDRNSKAIFSYRRRPKKEEAKKKDNFDRRPFIPVPKPAFTDEPFEKGAGIDFYIDKARYLPTSMTISKILVRYVDSELSDVIAPTSKVSELTSRLFEPEFNYRFELRFPYFNPTIMAVITLFTVDVRDDEGNASIVGYSFFPLFLDRNTQEQPDGPENNVPRSNPELLPAEGRLSNTDILPGLLPEEAFPLQGSVIPGHSGNISTSCLAPRCSSGADRRFGRAIRCSASTIFHRRTGTSQEYGPCLDPIMKGLIATKTAMSMTLNSNCSNRWLKIRNERSEQTFQSPLRPSNSQSK